MFKLLRRQVSSKYACLVNRIQLSEFDKLSPEEVVSITGRIDGIRTFGDKLFFFDITEGEHKVQAICSQASFLDLEGWKKVEGLKRGDIVEAHGHYDKTSTIKTFAVNLLTPSHLNLPTRHKPIADPFLMATARHLDLICSPEKIATFKKRSRIVQQIRSFLDEKGFLEVETPILMPGPETSTPRPFQTKNWRSEPLSLRIAPELYLKQLVVGGIPRVYELGKVFRDEGVDPTHLPEFTALEAYMAYEGLEQMMSLTEDLLAEICIKNEVGWNPPFPRIEMIPFLERVTESKLKDLLNQPKDSSDSQQKEKRLDELIERHLLPLTLKRPIFFCGYPSWMSPFAKQTEDGLTADRFELHAGGLELANAYVEQDDPQAQRTALLSNNSTLSPSEEHFIEVLKAGMPPTTGLGIGIDRLVMLMLGLKNICDSVFFPIHR